MFIDVGLGLILDLHPCKTAQKRLGYLELGERKLLPAFWPAGSEGLAGSERQTGRRGEPQGRSIRMLSLPGVRGWRSLERQRERCRPACQNRHSEHGYH